MADPLPSLGLVIRNLYQQRDQMYKETMNQNKMSPRVIIRVLIFNAIMMVVMMYVGLALL